MKKYLAMFLALALCLCLSVTAYAEEDGTPADGSGSPPANADTGSDTATPGTPATSDTPTGDGSGSPPANADTGSDTAAPGTPATSDTPTGDGSGSPPANADTGSDTAAPGIPATSGTPTGDGSSPPPANADAGSDTATPGIPTISETLYPVILAPEVQTSPTYSTYALNNSLQSRNSGALADSIALLFGEYQPRTQTVTDHLSDGTSVSYEQYVPGVAGMDWEWISGVLLFTVVLWSLFKLLGVFFKNV